MGVPWDRRLVTTNQAVPHDPGFACTLHSRESIPSDGGRLCAQLEGWPGTRIGQDDVWWKPTGGKEVRLAAEPAPRTVTVPRQFAHPRWELVRGHAAPNLRQALATGHGGIVLR